MEIKDLHKDTILFSAKSGSHAYGLSTPTSDIDIRGIFIAPINSFYSLNIPDQVSDDTNDTTYYELKRFMQLLSQQNPNIIELLNIPDDCILYKHPLYNRILENKDKFITRNVRNTFGGYAVQQIKKSRSLNKKMFNPIDKVKKLPIDFCYVPENGKTITLTEWLGNLNMNPEKCGLTAFSNIKDTYALYYDDESKTTEGGLFRGICFETSNDIRLSSIPMRFNMKITIYYNKDAYSMYCKRYKEYWEWVKNRNPHRYEKNMEVDKGYDCYLDSETLFLTEEGWKSYDAITDLDKLATFDTEHKVVYQKYTGRVDDQYSGKMYYYENRYTRFAVTENHKLYLSHCHRTKTNKFSTKFDENNKDFNLISVSEYFNGRRSYMHALTTPSKYNDIDYSITDDYIILLGAYLSDGSLLKSKNGRIKGVSISQLDGGRLCEFISRITSMNINLYQYERHGRVENTYNIYDTKLGNDVLNICGEHAKAKKLPTMVREFSKRQFDLLLATMIAGDGTHHKKKGHHVYYTFSMNIAIDLQRYLFLFGYNVQMYDYTDKNLGYHIFISNKKNKAFAINKMIGRANSGWKINDVTDTRIVCFEVPNSILITKNNNKIAIHGNSKNMMHTVRLLRMAEEMLRTGELNVRRNDREELLDIRNGLRDYDELVAYSEEKLLLLDELVLTSPLPGTVDMDFMNKLLIEMRDDFYTETR